MVTLHIFVVWPEPERMRTVNYPWSSLAKPGAKLSSKVIDQNPAFDSRREPEGCYNLSTI